MIDDEAVDMSMEAMASGPSAPAQAFHKETDKASGDHSYYLNGKRIPGVSELVEKYGHSRPINEHQEVYAERGRRIHEWLEHDDRGVLEQYDPPSKWVIPFMDQWREALAYLPVANITAIEEASYAIVNGAMGDTFAFAGTCDRLATLEDGTRALIDIKTTTGARQKHYRIKLALYARIWSVEARIVVYLTGEPGWKPYDWIDEYDDEADDIEADRIIGSASYRAHKMARRAWMPRPAKALGEDPDMGKCPF